MKVWDEREVAFLMHIQHERLVRFIGAGVRNDPVNGLPQSFTVQEYMSGGSLDSRSDAC